MAFQHGFLEKPIVNIWIKEFIKELKAQFPQLNIQYPKFKYISTIDIDNAYLYRGKGFVRLTAFLLKAIGRFNFEAIKMAFLVTTKKRKDPFDTYSLQFNLQKKYNLDVRYFMLLGDYTLAINFQRICSITSFPTPTPSLALQTGVVTELGAVR